MSGLVPVSFKAGIAFEPRRSAARPRGRRSDRYWHADEEAIIRAQYPMGGAALAHAALVAAGFTQRHLRQVYAKAYSMGVKYAGPAGGRKKRRVVEVPADIDDRIRAGWPDLKGRGAVDAFADALGVPRWWLSKQMVRLGLTRPHSKEPVWTDAEIALMRRVPLHDPYRSALIFREHGFVRTATAIMVKAKRLQLSRRYGETLSARSCAKILGVDDKHVTALCIAGTLRASKRGTLRVSQQGGDHWSVAHDDLRRYVLDNLEMIDIRKVEKFAFVALLTHPQASKAGDA